MRVGTGFSSAGRTVELCLLPALSSVECRTRGRGRGGLFGDPWNCSYKSELQLDDELHVAGAAVAEIRIEGIRRAGQTEA
jgi:hypothetical protein